jgi:hypothetical protein
MPQIVLTPEQALVVSQSHEPVDVVDDRGRVLTRIIPLSPEELEAIERHKRMRGQPKPPGVPSHRVEALLRKLDDLDARGEASEATVKELLRRTVAGESV